MAKLDSPGDVRLAREPLLLAQPGREPRALERREVVDEDLADEVIHFVLDADGEHAFRVELEGLAARRPARARERAAARVTFS